MGRSRMVPGGIAIAYGAVPVLHQQSRAREHVPPRRWGLFVFENLDPHSIYQDRSDLVQAVEVWSPSSTAKQSSFGVLGAHGSDGQTPRSADGSNPNVRRCGDADRVPSRPTGGHHGIAA